jgi:arylsulfatase A-like enzyme
MKKRIWFVLCMLLGLLVVGQAKPNIVFILADDLGYGDVGCFGQEIIKTPHLDQMAEEGMRLTDFYSGSTVCAPSRCALMTGRHTGHGLIRNNSAGDLNLRPEDVTIAKLLKNSGYTNGIIGKWGLGQEGTDGVPRKQGFDYFFGYLDQKHAHNYYPEFIIRNEERVKLRNVVPNAGERGDGIATVRLDYSHDLFAEEALAFVTRNKDNPFFLYLAFTIPHANNEKTKATGEGNEVPSDEPYSDKDWPQPEKNKAAMITRLDKDIGRLFVLFKELGIDENTLVIFTSDNGPHQEGGNDPAFFTSSGPHQGIKRAVFDGGIRVPTIARWPGKIAAGTTSDSPFAFWDVMPTLAELAGQAVPDNCDGISFLPTLLGQGKEQKQHPYLYWEFSSQKGKQAVRMGPWKGIRRDLQQNANAPLELYDVKADPFEGKNVVAEHPEVAEKILSIMKEAHVPSKDFPLIAGE